jgi:hypothetical protein
MKIRTIMPVLLVALSVSCVPATTSAPAETAVSIPTFTPVPLENTQTPPASAAIAPTLTPENVVPTSEPTSSLSADGPWLLYVHNSPREGFADLMPVPPEFILLNQDGSGRTSITPITLPECYDKVSTFLMEGGNSANYMAHYGAGCIYFDLSRPEGCWSIPSAKLFTMATKKAGC